MNEPTIHFDTGMTNAIQIIGMPTVGMFRIPGHNGKALRILGIVFQ